MLKITSETQYRVTLQAIARMRAMVASWEPLTPGIDPVLAKASRDGADSILEEMEEDALAYRVHRIFEFLCGKYVQRADDRQKQMGLQYTEAETHDLARELAKFIELDRPS